MDYDAALKAIFQSSSATFFAHLLGSKPVRQLNVEFVSVEKRLPDLLFELADGRILHCELQVDNDATMPWRMLQYCLLLMRSHPGRDIVQLVLYVGNPTMRMMCRLDRVHLQFDYRLHDIREFSGDLFLASDSPVERALSLLCPSDDVRRTLERVLRSWNALPVDQIQSLLETLVILSGLRGLKSLVKEELPAMAINTELLIRDNEWFQEWKAIGVTEGKAIGVTEGKAIGVTEGKAMGVTEGKAAMLRRLITQRFGAMPSWVSSRLDSATSQALDEWALRVLDANTIDQIFQ